MASREVLELLASYSAVLTDTHVVYTKGQHGSAYVNKDVLYPHTDVVSRLCLMMAAPVSQAGIDVVAGPTVGGVILSQWTASHLMRLSSREVLAVYAEKDGEGFVIKRGYDRLIAGKRVLVVEDILTTGGSVKAVVAAVRAAGGHVDSVFALCNRGGVTAAMIDAPILYSLVDVRLNAYNAGECPLCASGVKFRTDVGHAKEFLANHPELAHLAP